MKIGICLPLGKSVEGKFFSNFIDVLMDNVQKYEIDIFTQVDVYIDRGRNELAKKAILNKCDYVWFIDSDHILPKGTLNRLLKIIKDKNASVVSALYFTRTNPNLPVIRKIEEGGFEQIFEYQGIIEVDGVGMGCCLIKTEIFKGLEYPYFDSIYEKKGDLVSYIGEDLFFCRTLRNKGIKIYVDTDLVIKHIGGIVDENNYNPYKKGYLVGDAIKREIIGDLADFSKLSKEEVKLKVINGTEQYMNEWNEANPKTKEEREEVYKNSKWQKFESANWHLSNRLSFDVNLIRMIKKKHPNNDTSILDYGCGTGQNSYLLAKEGYTNLTLHDLNTDFAEFRFKKHNFPYFKFDETKKFDVILCFDMLEHLDDKDFEDTINLFKRISHKDTEFCLQFHSVTMEYTQCTLTETKKRLK